MVVAAPSGDAASGARSVHPVGAVNAWKEFVVSDPFDVNLTDGDLLREVELTTVLIVAASEHEGPLTQHEIDGLLGVVPVPKQR